jgi:hypothetical protein
MTNEQLLIATARKASHIIPEYLEPGAGDIAENTKPVNCGAGH